MSDRDLELLDAVSEWIATVVTVAVLATLVWIFVEIMT